MKRPRSKFISTLNERILVLDGAMGTMIEKLGVNAEALSACCDGHCMNVPDYLNITNPQGIAKIHRLYLEAGCDIVETNTFGANRIKLAEYDLAKKTYEINFSSAKTARRVCDEFEQKDGRPRFVAGSMGPTGFLPSSSDPSLGGISPEELEKIYFEQAEALIDGGADYLLIETGQDILEVRSALLGAKLACAESDREVPVFCQVTLDENGFMLLGTRIQAVATTLAACGADGIGMNCSTGPEEMRESVRLLDEICPAFISVIPNAGMPINIDGKASYPLSPEDFASQVMDFVKRHGVNIVGGCCGTTPDHIRSLAQALGTRKPSPRKTAARSMLSSAMNAVSMFSPIPPLLVGERMNTQGSRAFKDMMLQHRYDEIPDLARKQIEYGAGLLDLCVVLSEDSDEAGRMEIAVKKLRGLIDAPLLIDSTVPSVMETALRHFPGRCVLNSVSLESRSERFDPVMRLAQRYGAAVVALTVDERGMALDAGHKIEIAEKILEIAAEEYGLGVESFIFDLLTFTLASGDTKYCNSARETIEGIRLLNKKHPGILTSLGVSNVSFGLKPAARKVLNSVFLHHCVNAGLSWAMVNPAALLPFNGIGERERQLAEDLIFNRSPDALAAMINHFESSAAKSATGKTATAADAERNLPPSKIIYAKILEHRQDSLDELLTRELQNRSASAIINELLLPAMKEVGDRFGRGELILPFVLQSAEVMKKALTQLEPHMEKGAHEHRGSIVLATVYGDVHDIGKNLAATIFSNNGYKVTDLGKQVPVKDIVDKAVEIKADAIGLSALLVSTSRQMQLVVDELQRRELRIPLIIGGAAINRSFGNRIRYSESGSYYEGGVFYARDVFEGLSIMDELQNSKTRAALLERCRMEAAETRSRINAPQHATAIEKLQIAAAPDIPSAPFIGSKVIESIALKEIFALLNRKTLFRLHWGLKGIPDDEYRRKVSEEFEPLLESLMREVIEKQSLHVSAVYGYFPCRARNDSLLVFSDLTETNPAAEFNFARQQDRHGLCLSDYFAKMNSNKPDICALQLVSVGGEAVNSRAVEMAAGKYSRAVYMRGLAAQLTEAAAEWITRRIRSELKIEESRGRRFSPGYSSWPDLANQKSIFRLLEPSRIGVELNSANLMEPEESSSALFVHHPQVDYFGVKAES